MLAVQAIYFSYSPSLYVFIRVGYSLFPESTTQPPCTLMSMCVDAEQLVISVRTRFFHFFFCKKTVFSFFFLPPSFVRRLFLIYVPLSDGFWFSPFFLLVVVNVTVLLHWNLPPNMFESSAEYIKRIVEIE